MKKRLVILVFSNKGTILQQIYVKNVHQVWSAGIRNHDLQYISLTTTPVDQGSRPIFNKVII